MKTKNKEINKVYKFKHLGTILESVSKISCEIEETISKGIKAISEVNLVLLSKNFVLVYKTKTLTKSLVETLLLYSAEIWSLGRQKSCKLFAREMDFLWWAPRQ